MSGARVLFVLVLCLTGCRQDMHDQPRLEPLEKGALRPRVEGTIARGQLRRDPHLCEGRAEQQEEPLLFPTSDLELERALTGLAGDALAGTFPFPVTGEVRERGRDRFDIFCAPCHGLAGYGDGIVVERGFRPPPSYHSARLREVPVGHFFDVMTRGLGAMEDFADRVPVRDRWAIAAYIRVLQRSQNASVADLPDEVEAESLAVAEAPLPPAEPRLQVDPATALAEHLATREKRLTSYGWIDREQGIVHIPVERAMEIEP